MAAAEESLADVLGQRQVAGLAVAPLLEPTADPPFEEPVGPTMVREPDRDGVDRVELHERVDD